MNVSSSMFEDRGISLTALSLDEYKIGLSVCDCSPTAATSACSVGIPA